MSAKNGPKHKDWKSAGDKFVIIISDSCCVENICISRPENFILNIH